MHEEQEENEEFHVVDEVFRQWRESMFSEDIVRLFVHTSNELQRGYDEGIGPAHLGKGNVAAYRRGRGKRLAERDVPPYNEHITKDGPDELGWNRSDVRRAEGDHPLWGDIDAVEAGYYCDYAGEAGDGTVLRYRNGCCASELEHGPDGKPRWTVTEVILLEHLDGDGAVLGELHRNEIEHVTGIWHRDTAGALAASLIATLDDLRSAIEETPEERLHSRSE